VSGTNPTITTVDTTALGRNDPTYLRERVLAVVNALIVSLEPALRARVDQIPIVFDPNNTEVNAFATCSRGNKAAIAITNGMLTLTTNLAQLKAVDDVYATRWFSEYVMYIAHNQNANEPLLSPPTNWLTTEQKSNRSTLTRQLQLFDEIIAFVFGHELAHHYLNHLPCTSILPLDATEVGLLVTDTIPAFNQPNETAADVAGVRNVLSTNPSQLGHAFTEGGAIAQLYFFQALDNARPVDVFTFERTHPPPTLRVMIVQTAAQGFRAGTQLGWPWSN
jgi:Zn-dependent protease with chaperone function